MPVLSYFVTVGAALIAALLVASSYFESKSPSAAARVSVTPTTASLYIPVMPSKSIQTAASAVAPLDIAPPQRTKPHKGRH
jgi:hypothetical protein